MTVEEEKLVVAMEKMTQGEVLAEVLFESSLGLCLAPGWRKGILVSMLRRQGSIYPSIQRTVNR